MPEEPDLERRIRSGDQDALADYCQQQREKLLAALERKVGPGLRRKLELEDILQETVARALRDFGKIEFGDMDPLGWIYKVMDRQIVDLHRFHFEAQKREATREVSADAPVGGGDVDKNFADLLVASMTTPSAALSRDIKLSRVYEAMQSLSEDMRTAVRLRFLENLPSQKIAEKIGKSDAATRVLISRGIRKLQMAVGELEN